MAADPKEPGWDEQDQSETFDEENQQATAGGVGRTERRTFEELPDVYDVTSATGDADDEAALIAEELDDAEIIELEADSDATELEDDEAGDRTPETHRRQTRASRPIGTHNEVQLRDAGDLNATIDDETKASESLEADCLSDSDLAELGYADQGSSEAERHGVPGAPTRFLVQLRSGLWTLTRDGVEVHAFGHVKRAVHEAVELAGELRRTGEPAEVLLRAQDGKVIEITGDEAPFPGLEENSAVIPDRSDDA
jgi:hypothetical protein